MKKADLVQSLNAKFIKVGDPESIGISEGLTRYLVGVWRETDDNALNRTNIAFYVENEGLQNEVAYFEQSNPVKVSPEVPTPFADKVNALINQKITDGTIKGAVIENINEQTKTAYVKALVGTVERFAFVTDSNNDGVLEITLLG